MDAKTQPTDIDSAIGLLVRHLRTTAKISPNQCADAMGLSYQTYLPFERGERSVNLGSLMALQHLLNFNAIEFIDGAKEIDHVLHRISRHWRNAQ